MDLSTIDLMATIKDPNIKEIIAKEALQYKPKTATDPEQEARNIKSLENLLEVKRINLDV